MVLGGRGGGGESGFRRGGGGGGENGFRRGEEEGRVVLGGGEEEGREWF